ncbi:MAG: ComF family protein [Acidobacteriota bacterium]|jgi:ComF family protein|nr:ComF family protein [Acidobacteriota bacterium]
MTAHALCFPTARDIQASFVQIVSDSFLNLFYPEECFACSSPVARRQDCGLCDDCWRKVLALRIEGALCPSCGVPLPGFAEGVGNLCLECIRRPPPYSGARSFGYYSSEMRRVIHELKFKGRRPLVKLLAPLLADVFFESWRRDDFDCLVAVPLHRARRRERGFNQAELLCRALARIIGLPELRILRRAAATKSQVGLSDAQRLENVRNAFKCTSIGHVAGKRILLVDDVMTTGATVASASRALIDAGAEKVSVLTAARAVHL